MPVIHTKLPEEPLQHLTDYIHACACMLAVQFCNFIYNFHKHNIIPTFHYIIYLECINSINEGQTEGESSNTPLSSLPVVPLIFVNCF